MRVNTIETTRDICIYNVFLSKCYVIKLPIFNNRIIIIHDNNSLIYFIEFRSNSANSISRNILNILPVFVNMFAKLRMGNRMNKRKNSRYIVITR